MELDRNTRYVMYRFIHGAKGALDDFGRIVVQGKAMRKDYTTVVNKCVARGWLEANAGLYSITPKGLQVAGKGKRI